MTKYNWSEVNPKSTAYNQSGQNYFEQLSAYNSMSSHLRRILVAKCVVDARNKNYTCKRKQCNRKSQLERAEIMNSLIDILAYDTLHHPADLLETSCSSRCLCRCEDQKYFTDCYDYDIICSRSRLQNRVNCQTSSALKASESESFKSNEGEMKQQTSKTTFNSQEVSEPRYEEDSMLHGSAFDSLTQGTNHHLSMAVGSSSSYDSNKIAELRAKAITLQDTSVRDEEAKYAKFVYEITREIIRNGLYTDEELRKVFKKHLERNTDILNMDKMLYEIYRLKLSLNVSDDSDDEVEGLYDYQLSSTLKIRPPTPPKVLNENKVIEKLIYHKLNEDDDRLSAKRQKSVVLVDTNPALLITERDLLTSLIDGNIAPEQAQQICKELSLKSNDTIPSYLTQSSAERSIDEYVNESSFTSEELQKANGHGK